MCGIAGIILQQADPQLRSQLVPLLARLRHRGPDGSGTFVDSEHRVAIGHRRLAIIDPVGGQQPLLHQRLALIANGEVYNHCELRDELQALGHTFHSGSDSEVILHGYAAWGEDVLDRLAGMYAFALWDGDRQRLLLARDRLGIKPLFIARLPHAIAFASEIKALLPLLPRRDIDATALLSYLQYQFSSGEQTLISGIERLPPASLLSISIAEMDRQPLPPLSPRRYWSPLTLSQQRCDQQEAEQQFTPLMEQVMNQHMRSDVPFGLFLSGGVDSGILLALLSRYGASPLHTFSVGFPTSQTDDETALAVAIANRYGSHHTHIEPTGETLLQQLPLTIWAADELMRDNANLPTALLATEAGRELKVIFSGEGGDEVFAGYGRYRSGRLERWLKQRLQPGSGGFRSRGSFRGRWPQRLFSPSLHAAAKAARIPLEQAWQETPHHWSDLQRMQYSDLRTALPDNLLVKADRMLMAAAVEGRVPFLDHRVVEFGLTLPDHLKLNRHGGKQFLRRWAANMLPEETLTGRKRGFRVPLGQWTDASLLAQLRRILPHHPALAGWIEPRGVEYLIDHYHHYRPANRMLWSLIQFAIWHRLFISGDGERPTAQLSPIDLLREPA